MARGISPPPLRRSTSRSISSASATVPVDDVALRARIAMRAWASSPCSAVMPMPRGARPSRAWRLAAAARSRKYESWGWRLKGESATARRAWPEAEDALRRALVDRARHRASAAVLG